MLFALARLLRIAFRDKPVEFKPGVRYRVTLDLARVRPGAHSADVNNWLMTMGFTPTAKDNVWKGWDTILRRLPKDAILRAEKL